LLARTVQLRSRSAGVSGRRDETAGQFRKLEKRAVWGDAAEKRRTESACKQRSGDGAINGSGVFQAGGQPLSAKLWMRLSPMTM
jgi:hypothetical protein